MDYPNLKSALSDNLKSLEYLHSSRTWRGLRLAALASGMAALGYGVYKTFEASREEKVVYQDVFGSFVKVTEFKFKPSPFLAVGVGLSLSSIIPNKKAHDQYRKAIEHYNLKQ